MSGTWFDRHERFGDCKQNEVYIGQNVFAEFTPTGAILLAYGNQRERRVAIDAGGVSILHGALQEHQSKNKG